MVTKIKGLLDLKQAAALLKVSERGLRRLAQSGELPFHRVGRQLRFDPDELLDATRSKPARSA
jgi:excisionase family DNA binding protein